MTPSAAPDAPDDVSLVSNDPPYRLHQSVGLIPRGGGLGVGRRALLWTAIAWLPIVIWAWWVGRALPSPGLTVEPLLAHFGVHARLLVGIPLFIIAEAAAQRVLARLMPQFLNAGMVRPEDGPKFRAILARTARLRDAVMPWVIIVGLAFAWTFTGTVASDAHELIWAQEEARPTFGFGGWWYIYVGRPIFFALLLGWLWRLVLLSITLKRIAALDLAVVPTHADRAGGLGFIERFPSAFSLVVFVISLVISAGWGHQAEYHDLDVHTLYPMMIVALVSLIVIFLLPYAVFAGRLLRAKKQALLDYGALVARHGEAVREKWIIGDEKEDDPVLSAPEIGPVADTVALYEAVQKMRPVPLGKAALLAIAVPVAIPFFAVLAIQIPVRELLGQLLKGLL